MITCTAWVKRGAAKRIPDKVALSKEEIEELIEDARDKLRSKEEEEQEKSRNTTVKDEDSKTDVKIKKEKTEEDETLEEIIREYDLDQEDQEEGVRMEGAGMAGLTYYASNKDDPYILLKDDPDEEDEKQDWEIKPSDNLVITGQVEDEFCNLEIYVWDEEEENHYVHHDILLESFPLVTEWLDYDPSSEQTRGNYVAVGTMEPFIDIWDLDVVDTLEPVATLGKRRKHKKKSKSTNETISHTGAVLDLSWNHNVRNVLASASADHSVILWDLNHAKAVHVLGHHKDKVQSLEFHPYEPQSLLTGSFDKRAKVVDCRSPESNIKSWKFNGEVERVIWNHFSPFNFLSSTDNGFVYCCDVRTDAPVFTINAHDSAIAGLVLSSQVPNCLVTASADGSMKVWDIKDNKPSFILTRDMQMGHILSASCCPDSPFMLALGGEKQGLKLFDLMESAPVRRHFEGRERLAPVTGGREAKTSEEAGSEDPDAAEPMEEESAATALAGLSLGSSSGTKKKKKKKRK
ncbi:periodic tryptophan protein 1 homolog isoform X2 [Nematostella vectensis]|uniref:periodic tryptophan protein 1 homolog isoform X2 n=1 Tax=Nematostella vectensis TaxID=45351 RepID=UPI0020775F26|nr:periodic tryptophan protein 1 homolog isoform X2 [Nematostella vectensis]